MNKKMILILALLLPLCANAEKTMTKNEFTSEFIDYLKEQIPDSKFNIVSDLCIHTKNADGYELNISLANAYDVYKSGSRETELIFGDHLESIKNHKKIISDSDIKSILPVVKPRDYVDTAKDQLKAAGYDKDGLPLFFERINDDLYLMYVFDSQESMRFVSPDDVKKHGIKESIGDIASKNMERYFASIGAQLQEIDTKGNGRVYLFAADENYEASILVASDILNRIKIEIEGDLVVFIPARNIALLVDSKDAKAIQVASSLAVQGFDELGYSISPYGYVNVDGNWKRFKP